jgi:hypothetical protein
MMRNQRGVTMIGWIFLLIPMVVVLYAALRVGPEYFNYYKVVTAMNETATQLKSDGTLTVQTIKSSLAKRFDTGYIDNPRIDDMEFQKVENGWQMTANYERTQKMFGNLHLLMAFDKTVIIGRDAAAN